ncbi:F-box and leucine-rich repeat protein 13 isoform X1 [Anguilla rostrata]|uniref:F-box and leucine-rich repeat protein 13 isoform X1 n=2 Tax=Anguilla rostrata TaxID=7938 RepID=UPI0030D2221F
MASLLNAEKVLRDFISKHSLPEIYQALLAGLCAPCPESALHLLEMKIMEIQENWNLDIDWSSCIKAVEDITMAALEGNIAPGFFGNLDESMALSHLLEKAYSCYRKSLTKMCFNRAWVKFILRRRKEAAELVLKMRAAEDLYEARRRRQALRAWRHWLQTRKQRQHEAVKKIQGVWNAVLCRNVLQAWRHVAQDSKKTKEYFERLEKGLLETDIYHTGATPMEGQDGVSLLPWRAALKIFQNLEVGDLVKCGQVCRTWKAIAQTYSLWSCINFSSERRRITDEAVVRILQKYRPFVTRLNMRGCSALREPSFLCVGDCRNLRELNVSECAGVNDETLKIVLEGCPALLYLNLSYTAVTNSSFRALSRCCLNLQYLSLAYCRSFTDKGLQYLATGKGCHRIIYLDLSGCTQISVEGFRFIAMGCSLLQRVEFNDIPTLTDSCVLAMVSKCRSLNAVSLLDAPHLTDGVLKAVAEGCKLSRIRVEGNSHMTDASWKAFCRNSPGLKHISAAACRGLTDNGMRSIGGLKNLTSLNIADCVRVTDLGLRCLAEGPSGPRIQELNLSNCTRITDVSLMRIAQRCTSLSHLSLCYCDQLTDSGMEWLGSVSSLTSLDLTGTSIQDQGLTALGSNPSLRKLNVSECLWITDIGIEKFCKQLRGLEHMDVSHCLSLSDQSVKALSYHCRTIRSLRLAGCPKMTDVSVQCLMGTGQHLRELDVSGCVHLSDRAAKLLQRGCRQLSSVTMLYCRGVSKQAALRLRPYTQHWDHSRDDAPHWYGYNSTGQLFHPIQKPRRLEEHWEEEEEEEEKGRAGDK